MAKTAMTSDPPVVEPPVADPPADPPVAAPAAGDPPAADPPADPPADPDGNKPGDGAGEPKGQEPSGPPEKYELDLPDNVPVDAELMKEAEAIFREAGLDNDTAKKVAGLQVTAHEKAQEKWLATVEKWAEETKADPEIGGDKFEATVARVRSMITKYGNAGLSEALEKYGLGDHPEVVRFVDKMAQAMGEDSTPGKPPGAVPTADEMLRSQYPTMYNDDGSAKS